MPGAEGGARVAVRSVARGLLIAVPIVAVIVVNLASADAVFASLFDVELRLGRWVGHVVVLAGAAVVATGWFVQASRPPVSHPARTFSVGAVEATVVMVCLTAVYAVFAWTSSWWRAEGPGTWRPRPTSPTPSTPDPGSSSCCGSPAPPRGAVGAAGRRRPRQPGSGSLHRRHRFGRRAAHPRRGPCSDRSPRPLRVGVRPDTAAIRLQCSGLVAGGGLRRHRRMVRAGRPWPSGLAPDRARRALPRHGRRAQPRQPRGDRDAPQPGAGARRRGVRPRVRAAAVGRLGADVGRLDRPAAPGAAGLDARPICARPARRGPPAGRSPSRPPRGRCDCSAGDRPPTLGRRDRGFSCR